MTIHLSAFWEGVIASPFMLVGSAYVLHRSILAYRWLKSVAKGHPLVQWPALWAVSWGLPRLTKEYCLFQKMNDRFWFSPRLEKFRVLPRPEDLGQ